MRQKSWTGKAPAEKVVKDIRRAEIHRRPLDATWLSPPGGGGRCPGVGSAERGPARCAAAYRHGPAQSYQRLGACPRGETPPPANSRFSICQAIQKICCFTVRRSMNPLRCCRSRSGGPKRRPGYATPSKTRCDVSGGCSFDRPLVLAGTQSPASRQGRGYATRPPPVADRVRVRRHRTRAF